PSAASGSMAAEPPEQAASSSASAAGATGFMRSGQRGLGTCVIRLAIGQAVGATVDQACDLHEVPAVGSGVDVAAGPVPGGNARGVLRLCRQLRVVDQVQPQGLAGLGVVVAAGHLDVAAALVAHAVAGLGVAQVRAPLVGGAAGDLLHVAEAAALV